MKDQPRAGVDTGRLVGKNLGMDIIYTDEINCTDCERHYCEVCTGPPHDATGTISSPDGAECYMVCDAVTIRQAASMLV